MENLHKLKKMYEQKYLDRRLVFGEGDENAKVMLVGEAPGGEEEKQGRPFVGKAGKNLDEFIELAGLLRSELYITNVVKFRPTGVSKKTGRPINRTPNKSEIRLSASFKRRNTRNAPKRCCYPRQCAFKSRYRKQNNYNRRLPRRGYGNRRR